MNPCLVVVHVHAVIERLDKRPQTAADRTRCGTAAHLCLI
jgi:hypothetical protein